MADKRQIIKAIAALGRKLGRAPSRAQFLSLSGIGEYSVWKCFPKWNDAVKAAGLRPYTLNVKVEEQTLLEDWGKVARRNRGIPSVCTYRHEGKYDPSTIQDRFGRWSSVPEAFRHFAKGKREWKDVAALLPAPALKKETRRPNEHSCFPTPRGRARHAPLKDRPTYGNPTCFPWLRYEPVNEQGVVLLFGLLAKQLGYRIETVQTGYPDCEALRQIGSGRWQRVRIEFEFESSNFREHGHAANGCDVIVCWRHNWQECPEHLEVVELSRIIKSLASLEDWKLGEGGD